MALTTAEMATTLSLKLMNRVLEPAVSSIAQHVDLAFLDKAGGRLPIWLALLVPPRSIRTPSLLLVRVLMKWAALIWIAAMCC